MEWLFCPHPSFFFTFTIDEEHIGENSLNKRQFLNWVQHLMPVHGSFRYYAVGEYGDRTGRAHYHMAVFPEHPAQIAAIKASWKKGFVSASELNHERARYLANYTAKKLTKSDDDRLAPGQEPEFRASSRRPPLGAAFCDTIIATYKEDKAQAVLRERGDVARSFRVDGRIHPIGDWCLKRIRTALDIPLTHKGRKAANPRYESYYPIEEAEWNPEEAIEMEKYYAAKKRQKTYRGESPKL